MFRPQEQTRPSAYTFEREYRASILENLEEGLETFTRSAMTKIYQDKAFSARDLLQDYFMHNGFKKEE